jgi:hypothetical protein
VTSAFFLGGCSGQQHVVNPGEALYAGQEPLRGKIRGHRDLLPPEVVVCKNCHSPEQKGNLPAPAPRIDRAWLVEPRERRGGPASSYDLGAFCKVLRTGIDPAYVLIARIMPTYEIDDRQCASLWAFLTE